MIPERRRLALALGGTASVAVGVAWPAPEAEAFSCGCTGVTRVVAPAPGATDVPVDAFVWMHDGYGYAYYGASSTLDDFALIDQHGDEVEVTRQLAMLESVVEHEDLRVEGGDGVMTDDPTVAAA